LSPLLKADVVENDRGILLLELMEQVYYFH
jgi:hypothetical protein